MTTPAPSSPPNVLPESARRLEVNAEGWRRVSPKYAIVDLVGTVTLLVIFTGIAVGVMLLWQIVWLAAIAGVLAVISLIYAIFTKRRIRAFGYLLREDDLLFRRGIMWQRFVAVPYGRMQLVDITRGPLMRAFGLSELKFVTASAGTNVDIPGLPLAEAEELRDHLIAVAESRRSGL